MENKKIGIFKVNQVMTVSIILLLIVVTVVCFLKNKRDIPGDDTTEIQELESESDIKWWDIDYKTIDFKNIHSNYAAVNKYSNYFIVSDENEAWDFGSFVVRGRIKDVEEDPENKKIIVTIEDMEDDDTTISFTVSSAMYISGLEDTNYEIGQEREVSVYAYGDKNEDTNELNYRYILSADVVSYKREPHKGIYDVSQLPKQLDDITNATFNLEGAVYKIYGEYRLYRDYDADEEAFVLLEDSYDGPLAKKVAIEGQVKSENYTGNYSRNYTAVLEDIKWSEIEE